MSAPDTESLRPDDSGAIVLPPSAGRTIPGLEVLTLKLTDEQTRGAGPPRHIHRSSDELFYVLAGRFLFLVGERLTEASPGTVVFVPRGTVHAAR